MSWDTVELASVADINPRMPRGLADDLDVSFLPMAAVSEAGQIDYQEERKVEQARKGYTYFRRGDVLVAKITPCFENGKATKTDALDAEHGFGSTEFHVIRGNPSELLPEYAFHLIWNPYFRKEATANMTGSAGQKRVPADFLKRFKIPLPPLEEQRRIAGILDAADALRRRRRETLALLNTLPGAIFAEMFGALTTSDRFPRGPLSDLIRGFDTGKNLAPASDEEGARHRVLKVSAVTKGEFIEAESKPLPADYSPPASHFVKPGDLLFSRANTSALIGATAMVENVSDNIVLPDKIWRFILDPEKAEPTFLHYLFSTRKFRDEVSRRATGSSGSMKNISKAKVLSIEVGQPPIEMQRDFTRKVRICRDLRAKVSGHLAELEVIFASFQSRAFAGEL